jgi:hypothetical protein
MVYHAPPSDGALLPCLLPLNTLKKIRDQNLLVLEQVDTLKQLNRESNTEEELEDFPLKEYRLHGKPQSLKEFLDLFLLESGEYDMDRAIWIPESDAFVCIEQGQVEGRVPGVFEVTLLSDKHSCGGLSVFSPTVEQAIPCLEFLFGLHDSHFQELELSYIVPGDDEDEPHLCPLTNRCLEKLLIQNESRESTFHSMAFTPEQSRVLATTGTIIGLCNCSIPDGGAAFVNEARQHSSLTKLSLHERLPFDAIHFVWCLDYLNLEYLGLSHITLNGRQTCRAVATTEINYLHLEHCDFEDEGAMQLLVDNVREERGPRGLFLDTVSLSERFGDFMNALRGNTYLQRLVIGNLEVRDGSFQSLVAALPKNRGLTRLGLIYCNVDNCCWKKLMDAIAEHPSLRTLFFRKILDANDDEIESLVFKRHESIHALAGMLVENEQVDDIHVENDWCDRDVWNAVVVPRLEINSYRKGFRAIQAIGLDKTRAAVVARALAHLALADVKGESSLIFMVLSQNCDVFCSYLDEMLTRDNNISVPSRKRSHSGPH